MASRGAVPQNRAVHARVPLAASVFVAALFAALPVSAQAPLSLSEAIERAKARNPDAGSAAANCRCARSELNTNTG